MSVGTRFEKEAKVNAEMAYFPVPTSTSKMQDKLEMFIWIRTSTHRQT